MIEFNGPTGRLIKGNVLDVAVKPFVRAIQAVDPLLYVKWNPKKVGGWGCWEIRRRPDTARILDRVEFGGATYTRIGYKEGGMNHVLDCAYLNYDAIRKLRSMDTWDKNHWIHDLEYNEDKQAEEIKRKAKENLKYALKQNATAMRDLRQMILSGVSPHVIANEVGRLMSTQGE